jgi:Ca2+-binding EF-hand superfamily protein
VFELLKEAKEDYKFFLEFDKNGDKLLSEFEFVQFYRELYDSPEPFCTEIGDEFRTDDHLKHLFRTKLGGSPTEPIDFVQFMAAKEDGAVHSTDREGHEQSIDVDKQEKFISQVS